MQFCLSILLLGLAIIYSSQLGVLTLPTCDMMIGETIPSNLTYDNEAPILIPIWMIWADIISSSTEKLRLTSYYWTMLSQDVSNTTYFPSSAEGEMIFNLLLEKSKKIPIEIVQNGNEETYDLRVLKRNKLVQINYIDFQRLLGQGIQHSKVWIGDKNKAFVGSPNMDWRSISEVKELGVYITNCSEIVSDIDKFWQTMQFLSGPTAQIPTNWPSSFSPKYNHTHPYTVQVNGVSSNIFTATSPPSFNPPYRTDDLTAILRTIDRAEKYIHISVMDFFPLEINYSHKPNKFWPDIENHLKAGAIDRNISVKLLISKWKHTSFNMISYLRSLQDLSRISGIDLQVKLFIVPAFYEYQREIPFSRVSHSKYMVTDNTAYIGTSNWSGDYFKSTGGMSLVSEELNPNPENHYSIRTKLESIFNTDWYSVYAHDCY